MTGKIITYDMSANPLTNVSKKIDFGYICEPPNRLSVVAEQQMLTAGFHFGDFFKGAVLSPNWEEVGQGDFPSGFQFTVHGEAPVLPGLFSRTAMFATTLAVPLDAGVASFRSMVGSAPATEAFFRDPSNNVAAQLRAKIGADVLGAVDTNFAGIFATKKRTATGYATQLWCVAQSSSDEEAKRTIAAIEDAAPESLEASLEYGHRLQQAGFRADPAAVGSKAPHTTWSDFFVAGAKMQGARLAQQRHCAKTILRVMKTCGLGTFAASTDGDDNMCALLASDALVQVQRNTVEHFATGDPDLSYLSEMTSLHTIAVGGTIMREAPLLGPTILRGPMDVEATLAKRVVGFPYSVGRKQSVAAHNRSAALDAAALVETPTHVWDSTKAPFNTHLSPAIHRSRLDPRWTAVEQRFGFRPANGEVHLEPVVVMLAPTAQPVRNKATV